MLLIAFSLIFVFTNEGRAFNHYTLPKDSIRRDSLIRFCRKYLGTNYQYGSCSPSSGFDCSGFVYFVFNHFKIKVPRSSSDFINIGKTIHPDSFKVGDIIIFSGTNIKDRSAGHVGIILSNAGENLRFIHSSSNKTHPGIKISSFVDSPNYKKRFLKIIRIAIVY